MADFPAAEHPAADWSASPERYDDMPYARAGRSGLLLPRLSLGLWNNFGFDRAFEGARAIVLRAFDHGVTHFDLANNYGPPEGAAEITMGRILATDLHHHRDEIIISSKAGYRMWPGPYGEWGSRKSMTASLDQSLTRLGLDYVDVFYSHRPDPTTPVAETAGALASAVRSGKALYAAVSNYTPEQTREMAEALNREGVPLTLHQPKYNMYHRGIEEGLYTALDDVGAGCIVYSPLAGGLLTDRYLSGSIPEGSRAAEGRWLTPGPISEEYLLRTRTLWSMAGDRGLTLTQLALLWALRDPHVTSALIGARSVAQLDDSLGALQAPKLTGSELTAIEPLAVDGTTLH